ncbi:MAG TPA: hypothetical protein VFZ43_10995 [Anaerolineales bacterium]
MNDDTRRMIYGTLVVFLLFLVFWLGFVYISACGFTLTCIQGAPLVIRTPIPTLIPYERSQAQPEATAFEFSRECQVAATDLIGAWALGGYSENESFLFTDIHGRDCEGTFAEDIHPLFVENSLWYPGSLGCVSCHNADLSDRSAGLDLTSYDAILLGTRRVAGATSPGTDILGGGDWEESILHEVLVNQSLVPEGHAPDAPDQEVLVYAGQRVDVEVTATPTP